MSGIHRARDGPDDAPRIGPVTRSDEADTADVSGLNVPRVSGRDEVLPWERATTARTMTGSKAITR